MNNTKQSISKDIFSVKKVKNLNERNYFYKTKLRNRKKIKYINSPDISSHKTIFKKIVKSKLPEKNETKKRRGKQNKKQKPIEIVLESDNISVISTDNLNNNNVETLNKQKRKNSNISLNETLSIDEKEINDNNENDTIENLNQNLTPRQIKNNNKNNSNSLFNFLNAKQFENKNIDYIGNIEKDIPLRVIDVLQNNEDPRSLYIEIEWEKRSNGIKPKNSTYSNKRIREKFPYFLLDFYEDSFLLSHKLSSEYENDI